MIKIISDSTCDLSKELIEKYDISIIPLYIHLGEEEYKDGVNISPDDIYKYSDENNTTPKTAAPALTEVVEVFNKFKEDEIICFSISSEMSVTNQVMKMAAEEVGREKDIHIIDSKNLSTGIGLLVIEAAAMAKEGKNIEQILDTIEETKKKVKASFVVDTLTYLHRGGRCSSIAALAGGVLKLHPKIVVENGKMDASKKYRGKMKSVIMSYVKDMEESLLNAKEDRVFITHSGCKEETINMVKSYLEELDMFKEILITRAGGVISSHCGPGTLGVLYIEK